jgi:hypothetical protein
MLLVPGASLPAWLASSGPTTPATLSLLVLKLALLQGSLFAVLVVGLSQTQLAKAQKQTRTGPLLPSLGVLVLLLSVLGLVAAPLPFEPVIDWAALGPLLGLTLLAAGLWPAEAHAATSTSESSNPAVPTKVTGKADPEATLRQAGLLKAAPDLIFAAKSPASPTSSDPDSDGKTLTAAALHTLWQGCGGAGSPPTVLPKLLAGLGPTFQATRGRWLGDLPPDSLDLLTDCLLTSALWGLGRSGAGGQPAARGGALRG